MSDRKSIGYSISILNRYSQIYIADALKDLNLHGAGQASLYINT